MRLNHERPGGTRPLRRGLEVYVGRAMPRYSLPESLGRALGSANPYKVGRDGDLAEVLAVYEEYVRESFGLERIWLAFGYPSPVLGKALRLVLVREPRWNAADAGGPG